MSGLTWASNDSDDRTLCIKELTDTVLRLKAEREARGKPLKAIKLSRATLLMIPLRPIEQEYAIARFYGIPIQIDDSLGLYEHEEVYA